MEYGKWKLALIYFLISIFLIFLTSNFYTHIFSVTRYSIYLPSMSLVWASIPGSALKKNPTIGKRINSNGWNRRLSSEILTGLGGRCRASMIKITSSEKSESVRIAEDTCGSVFPRMVLEKFSFISGGSKAPIVIANQLTGQRK